MALQVVLADDNYLVREGTAALLTEEGGIDVVATAADLDGLLAAVEKHLPDAVLTDIRMPPGFRREGIEAAERIRRAHPATGVLVMSLYVREEYAYDLLEGGAAGLGYLLKERVSDVEEIVRALREVAHGGTVLDPRVIESLVARREKIVGSPLASLTGRERDVLARMAQGANNAAIARSLFITEHSVEKHISSVFQKLDLSEEKEIHRRVMAVLTFLRAVGEPADD